MEEAGEHAAGGNASVINAIYHCLLKASPFVWGSKVTK